MVPAQHCVSVIDFKITFRWLYSAEQSKKTIPATQYGFRDPVCSNYCLFSSMKTGKVQDKYNGGVNRI